MSEKRLTRKVNEKKIAGVCAGVANYFDIDPTIVRVIWGVLAFLLWGRNCSLYHFMDYCTSSK